MLILKYSALRLEPFSLLLPLSQVAILCWRSFTLTPKLNDLIRRGAHDPSEQTAVQIFHVLWRFDCTLFRAWNARPASAFPLLWIVLNDYCSLHMHYAVPYIFINQSRFNSRCSLDTFATFNVQNDILASSRAQCCCFQPQTQHTHKQTCNYQLPILLHSIIFQHCQQDTYLPYFSFNGVTAIWEMEDV